ncbi:hypothetical protein F4810DRAFT_724775 [Camillea tinctor]|nr:hypothetical protein F4810DRAFT_724775 [Camillea tinctor]
MRNYDLSQLASQVPGLIKEVSKKRQPQDPAPLDPLDLNTFFDFSSFYGEDQGADPDSRSRSDSSSTPELTSGSSEEDGAPSPGPNVDFHRLKDAVKKVKQQDDRFTVPQREIRPKGALPYPCKIQLDNAPSTNASGLPDAHSPTGVIFTLSSPSSTSSLSFDAPATKGSPTNRGKRNSPLKDASRVAEIRKIGACSRCKTRKVQCNEQVPCARCVKDASKYCSDDATELAKRMCIRHLFHINDCVFQAIGDTEANRSPLTPNNSHLGTPSVWRVSFGMLMSSEIDVPVVSFHTNLANGLVVQHDLDKHNLPQDSDIIRWASCQMSAERERGLQFALDTLLAHCIDNGNSYLPYFDIIEKVYQMRCWYRVWRQQKFFCQKYQGPEEVPDSIRQGLRNIAKSRMKGLEPQILEFFEKQERAAKSPQRLLIWASMMQMLLLYRDMYDQLEHRAAWYPGQDQTLRMAANLFSKLVVTCELHFGKKKPEPMVEDGSSFRSQVNLDFVAVERHYIDFYDAIRQRPWTLDHQLLVLHKGSTGCGARAPKRARRSN